MFDRTLAEAAGTNTLVAIHIDPTEPGRFDAGWVHEASDEGYSLLSIDPYANFDAIRIGFIDDIVRINVGGQYLDRLAQLCEGTLLEYRISKGTLPANLEKALQMCCESGEIVTVSTIDKASTNGIIEEVADGAVRVREVSLLGFHEGQVILPIDDISTLDARGPKQAAIRRCFERSLERMS
jgi:hypothetical protein